jgi:hypothetical protein
LLEITERGEDLLLRWGPRLAPIGVDPAGAAPTVRLDGVTRLRY